jgi:hypothetical protein
VRAAIPHQVELDIAPAPVGLEVAFALAEGHAATPLDDRQIGAEEGIPHRAHQREAVVESTVGEVVEEHAADAARLGAVLEMEVLVAPPLEARIERRAERRQRVTVHAMEGDRILLEAVVRRQVHTAAEPAHRVAPGGHRSEHPHVHVHRRHIGVARMQHERDTERLERRPGQLGPMLRRRRRHRRAAHVTEIAAAALEQGTLLDEPRDAVALEPVARRTRPCVAQERLAVCRLQGIDDARLQAQQIGADRLDLHRAQCLIAR